MKLKSELQIPSVEIDLDHSAQLLTLGSCFADEIGHKLQEHLFDCCSNPLGTLFNPLAIAAILDRALTNNIFSESEFFEHQELWRHDLVHSSLATPSLHSSVEIANTELKKLQSYLIDSELLILTFGSSWIYELKESKQEIGHNHRRPLDLFEKRLVKPPEIFNRLTPIFETLKKQSPSQTICLTVSPVRHTKDGLHENNVSKSCLHLSAFEIQEKYPHVHYFPAYEILNDELRDYRFFADDLAHPSEQSIKYIWKRFADTYLDKETLRLSNEIAAINSSLSHRPQHVDTSAYQNFKDSLLRNIEQLNKRGIQTGPLVEKWNKLP